MEERENFELENLEEYRFNKYAIQLKKYKNILKGDADIIFCAKLRGKAKLLKEVKTLELYNYLTKNKNLKLNKVEKLFKSGADLKYTDKFGMTFYMLAGLRANAEILSFLYDYGANEQAFNKMHQNAYMLVQFAKNNREVANLLCGDFKKYLPVIRLMQTHGVNNSKDFDIAGLSIDEYMLGKTAPYTKTIENFILSPFNLQEFDVNVKSN